MVLTSLDFEGLMLAEVENLSPQELERLVSNMEEMAKALDTKMVEDSAKATPKLPAKDGSTPQNAACFGPPQREAPTQLRLVMQLSLDLLITPNMEQTANTLDDAAKAAPKFSAKFDSCSATPCLTLDDLNKLSPHELDKLSSEELDKLASDMEQMANSLAPAPCLGEDKGAFVRERIGSQSTIFEDLQEMAESSSSEEWASEISGDDEKIAPLWRGRPVKRVRWADIEYTDSDSEW